jgi:regulator of protease activity HflC (stomatin/prohibitin superfamily)
MFRLVHVREHERGLWFRRGDFQDLILPGSTWLLSWNDKIQIVDTLNPRFEHPLLEMLITKSSVLAQIEVVNLDAMQRAIVWKDGRLLSILGPGLHAFWKTSAKLVIETFDIAQEFRFAHRRLAAILQHGDATKFLEGVAVTDHEDVLLYRDGVLIDRLGQGLHVFWKGNGKIAWKAVDRREQTADVAGQEIITADKVSLRVNLVVTYTVSDALRAVTSSTDYTQALYREAQLVLRAAVGTKTLDSLLSDKESVGAEVREALTKRAVELGISVKSVGLRDIILPGDMKTLLNQVIAATKEAEANLIRRREETAAARSQANTAKLLAENPLLVRLKELELLKDVLAGTNTTFVLGQGDLSDQLRSLVATTPKS